MLWFNKLEEVQYLFYANIGKDQLMSSMESFLANFCSSLYNLSGKVMESI
ncbi:MAG: hypothetical protein WCO29_21545 [Nostocales cyanobacterium ELA583]|jgi:hypothetical protein